MDTLQSCTPCARPKSSLPGLTNSKTKRAQVRIAARLRQAESGSLGDWQPVEGEVSALRVHYGPGYRLYFVRRGKIIVVMLNAGDKSTHKRDIRRALKLAPNSEMIYDQTQYTPQARRV